MIKELLSAVMMSDEGSSNLPAVTEEDNGKILSVVNGEWNKKEPETDADSVKYTAQELTTAQQMQARENLGLYYTEGEETVIEWDGDTTGKEAITTDRAPIMYKVSDDLLTANVFVGANVVFGGTSMTISEEEIETFDDSVIAVFVFSGKAGIYDSENLGVRISVPEDGTYLYNADGAFVSSFASSPSVHKIEEKYLPDTSETITETTDSTLTLVWHDTTVVTNTPTALTVNLPTPVSGKDCICGLNFKAGTGFALTDSAPTGYTIVWPDEPTWTAGNVYEIIYRYLGIDGIISAKYSEVSAT